MNSKGKISAVQLFMLLSVSRLLSTLTFVPSFGFEAGVSDYIIATLIGGALMWIACIPLFIFLKNGEEKSLVRGNKALSLFYCVFFLFSTVFVLLRLRLFVSSVFFNTAGNLFFTVITVAAVCYCASFSLEALGRAGSISFVLLCASLGIIFFALNGSLDINNLSPVFYYGASPVVKLALGVLVRSSEPAVIYILAPRVSGNLRKGLAVWLCAITAAITLCGLFLMLSLSDAALLQAFPFHAMAELSRFSVFERMDAVFSGIWIMSAFLKAVLFTLIIKELFTDCFARIRQRYFLTGFGVLVGAVLLIAESSVLNTAFISSIALRGILFFVFVLILPCFILIKRRKRV